jgi:hypothetical protein
LFGLQAPTPLLYGQRPSPASGFGRAGNRPNGGGSGPGWLAVRNAQQRSGRKGKKSKNKNVPKSCQSDDDCPSGYYCSALKCRKVKSRINIAYLFYLSGDRRFLSVLGLYMHKKGKKKGFRMVFPFYWHFWSPKKRARVVFPFFWRFHRAHDNRTDTLVGPFHHWKSKKGKGFNFWPFLFYANYGKKGTRFSLFPFGHYERRGKFSGYGFLTPLGFYYGSKSPRHRTWAMLPWAYGTATRQKAVTWVFPFNFYWRRQNARSWLFAPLAYAHRSPTKHRTIVLPLVWIWGTHKTTNAIGFPLVYHFARGKKSFTLVPPFFHYQRGKRYVGGAVPLLYYGRNPKTDSFHLTVAPLFHYSRSGKQKVSRFFSPLFMWKKDGRSHSRWWAWTLPPIISKRSLGTGLDVVFPLYWRYFDKSRGTDVVCVPPFLYYKDRFQRNSFFFPFWWNFRHRSTGAYVRALLPLFYQQRAVDGRTVTVAGPGYLAHGGKKPWHAGLVPLLFFGAGKHTRHAVVFPLFWHFSNRNKQTQTTVAGPFYWARRKKRWHTGLAPLFFMGSGKTTSYQTIFPLFWHLHNRKEKWHTAVAGPAFAHWGQGGWQAGLAPFLFFGDKNGRSHHIVAPLFAHWADRKKRERTLIAGPGYYWRRQQDWGWGVAPFVFFQRRYKKGYVSSKLTVPPFLHLARDRHRELLITPLGGYAENRKKRTFTGVAGPVIWHRSPKMNLWAVLPWVYRWKNNKTKVTTTVGFPYIQQRSPKSSATVLFPFFWRFKNPQEKSMVVFPFYWRLRQKKGWHADVVFPFYWDLKKKDRRFFMAGPYYKYNSKYSRQVGVWPLFHYKRDKKKKHTSAHFFPFFWYSRDDIKKTSWMVAGPYYASTSKHTAHKGVVPFAFWGHKAAKHYRIGFPFYWDFENKKDKKRILFAGPFFYHRNKTEKGGGLLPLVWYRSDPSGMRQLTLAPFFHYKQDPSRFTLYTPLAGWSVDKAKAKHHGYVGPYIWNSTPKKRFDIFFPLFWRFKDRDALSTTTFIPPLLYWGQHSPDKKVDLVFPFFWMKRTVTGRSLVVFPFWYDFHNYYKGRTTAVFPLFYRKRNYPKDQTTWFFPPGVWIKHSPKKTSAIALLLFWHFAHHRKSNPKSTTVFFPLYWDFKRSNSRTTIFAPFYWYFDRPNKTYLVVLNNYYRKNKKKGTYRFYCIPFFDFGREPRATDFRFNIFGGLIGYRRVGRNRYLKIFWYPFKLSPAPPRKKPRQAQQNQKAAAGASNSDGGQIGKNSTRGNAQTAPAPASEATDPPLPGGPWSMMDWSPL